jgi:hypothetical protein
MNASSKIPELPTGWRLWDHGVYWYWFAITNEDQILVIDTAVAGRTVHEVSIRTVTGSPAPPSVPAPAGWLAISAISGYKSFFIPRTEATDNTVLAALAIEQYPSYWEWCWEAYYT